MYRSPSARTTTTLTSPYSFQWALALLFLVLTTGCAPTPDPGSRIIATYRDGTVTADELDRWLTFRKLKDQPNDPSHEINQMVLTRTLSESALANGLDRDRGVALKLEMAEMAVLERAFHRHLAESVTVTDSEIDSLHASEPGAFSKPRRVRLFNLYKRFPPGASRDERARIHHRMQEIRQRLVAGADFSEVALAESDSETRYRGGRMGTFEDGELPQALNAVVMKMAEGEISEVLETPDGLTILKCHGIFDAKTPTAAEVRSKIETNLLRIRRQTVLEDYREETLAASGLRIELDRALDPTCPPGEIIATFSDNEVSQAGLTILVAARRPTRRHAQVTENQARSTLEAIAVTTLTAAHARELGLDNEVVRAEARARQTLILATEELGRMVRSRIQKPTSEEIVEYFTTHRSEFRHPEELDLMAIVMTFTEETLVERHAEARAALDAVYSGSMTFEQAVRRYSEIPNPDGSPVMTLTTRQLASYGASVGKAVRSLKTGDISGLIRQDNRLFIVKLINRRPSRPLDFDTAEGQAGKRLGQIRIDEATAQIEAEILERAQIELAAG